jgi:hypothetical protein
MLRPFRVQVVDRHARAVLDVLALVGAGAGQRRGAADLFAVYPFAAELYRQSNIPKRLMPGAIALGAFSFTMDSLPGTPQIQNIIPTTFFKTTVVGRAVLGTIGSLFIIVVGLSYLEWRRRAAMAKGEGYGTTLQRAGTRATPSLPHPACWRCCRWSWSAWPTSR